MATLKISDLSVGDWIQDKNGIYAKVLGIENWSNGYSLNIELHGVNVGVTPLTSAHPIPITAEALEKNGFMRCSVEFNIYEYTTLLGKMLRTTQVRLNAPQQISVFVHDTTIERGYYHREKISVSILKDKVYIHELQHALRLAGVEKEINL
jgi:hypothetical protein